MATSTAPGASARAKSARRQRREQRRPTTPPVTRDLIVLGAAVVGLLVSAYLLLVDLTGGTALCLAGADCDIVRESAYGKVFGIPVAALGVGFFLAAGIIALLRTSWQPRALQVLGGVGLGTALVFVAVQGFVLNAWCPYCLVADAAALTIGLRVFWPRQRVLLPGDLARGMASAALAVAVLMLGYAASPASAGVDTGSAEQAQLAALADHLKESGAVFYGAYWCPHCQNQKQMFGAAASRLPYVECDPRGANAQPAACQAAGVRAFPTWVINGQKLEGEVSVSDLARLSNFTPSSATP
ncbi:MAG: vitamin K epoxide reductase family protein [Chloroflexota bacterium]